MRRRVRSSGRVRSSTEYTDRRTRSRVVAVLAMGALLVAGCGGDDETTTSSTSTSTAPSSTGAGDTTSTTVAGTVIEVEVADGAVVGGAQRHDVHLGDTVTIAVTSDVADELHVHGYDLKLDLEPAERGAVTFEADIPGVFEFELEDHGLELGRLQVR